MRARILLLIAVISPPLSADADFELQVQNLTACYRAWCGDGWEKAAGDERFAKRTGDSVCASVAWDDVAQADGKQPLIFPMTNKKDPRYLMFLGAHAYTCNALVGSESHCAGRVTSAKQPCTFQSGNWESTALRIPASPDLGTKADMHLAIYDEKKGLRFGRAVGAARVNSPGRKATPCTRQDTISNRERLESFLTRVLEAEASLNGFKAHLDRMEEQRQWARVAETSFRDPTNGEDPELAYQRETLSQTTLRKIYSVGASYSSKSAPIGAEEQTRMRAHYGRQLRVCGKARGLSRVAEGLLKHLEGEHATLAAPGPSTTN